MIMSESETLLLSSINKVVGFPFLQNTCQIKNIIKYRLIYKVVERTWPGCLFKYAEYLYSVSVYH